MNTSYKKLLIFLMIIAFVCCPSTRSTEPGYRPPAENVQTQILEDGAALLVIAVAVIVILVILSIPEPEIYDGHAADAIGFNACLM